MAIGKPTKRSVTIAGHETSISLEPLFWQALERAAVTERLPINALIARIDVERLDALDQRRPAHVLSAAGGTA